jgi:hypothetical protein
MCITPPLPDQRVVESPNCCQGLVTEPANNAPNITDSGIKDWAPRIGVFSRAGSACMRAGSACGRAGSACERGISVRARDRRARAGSACMRAGSACGRAGSACERGINVQRDQGDDGG